MAGDIRSRRTPISSARTGRLLLRLPSGLHRALREAARAAGLSLNEYCTRRLAAPAPGLAVDADAVLAVSQAADLFGERLVAVVLYGSWATGLATESSDVDLLIVVERKVPLTRALYRRWDQQPLRWRDRLVDPHFTHAPGADEVLSAVWGEAALSGLLLYERDERVSRHLAQVRSAIAAGLLVRRLVHGQPYWVAAA